MIKMFSFPALKRLDIKATKMELLFIKKINLVNLILNENNEKIVDEDISEIISDYSNFKNNKLNLTSSSFFVDRHKVKTRFDYDYYSPDFRNLITSLENYGSQKLSDLTTIVKKKSSKIKPGSDKRVNYVELSDINTSSFEIFKSSKYYSHELPSRASYKLQEGDIITAIAGNSIGSRKHATALVEENHNGSICTSGFRIFRNLKINPYYLLYFLTTDYFLQQILVYRTGAAIPAISDNDLRNILVPIPKQNIIESISGKIEESIEMRMKSRKLLSEISLKI